MFCCYHYFFFLTAVLCKPLTLFFNAILVDTARVILQAAPEKSYINASYVDVSTKMVVFNINLYDGIDFIGND